MNYLTPKSSTSPAIAALEQRVRGATPPDKAAGYVKQVLAMFPGQRNRDDEIEDFYVAGLTAVLSDWPEWVVRIAADPRRGLASKHSFRPTPAEVLSFCNETMRPVVEELRAVRHVEEADRLRTEPEPSPADRASVQAMVEKLRAELVRRSEEAFGGRDISCRSQGLSVAESPHGGFVTVQCAPGDSIREFMG